MRLLQTVERPHDLFGDNSLRREVRRIPPPGGGYLGSVDSRHVALGYRFDIGGYHPRHPVKSGLLGDPLRWGRRSPRVWGIGRFAQVQRWAGTSTPTKEKVRRGGPFCVFLPYFQDSRLEELDCQVFLLVLAGILCGINASYFGAEAGSLTSFGAAGGW